MWGVHRWFVVAEIVALVVLGHVVPVPATTTPLPLAGTNRIAFAGSGSVLVEIPMTASLSAADTSNPDITVSGTQEHVAMALVGSDEDLAGPTLSSTGFPPTPFAFNQIARCRTW